MSRATERLSIIVLAGAFFSVTARAATFTAASCAQADVAAAVAQASVGDTVVIPACPSGVSWTAELDITTGIILMGQGEGNTVLIDNTPKPTSASCQAFSHLINVNVQVDQPWRLTAFTVQGSTPDTFVCNLGHMLINGNSSKFRVDHLSFTNMQTSGIFAIGGLQGVIDHCTFNGVHRDMIRVQHSIWAGVGLYGDNSWAQADTLGGAGNIFIEDNTFTDPSAVGTGCVDSEGGGRFVFRHNTCPFMGAHGLDTSGRTRSVRQYEVYSNAFTAVAASQAGLFLRGGTGMIFNNTFTDSGSNTYIAIPISLNSYRDTAFFSPWGPSYADGGCDGQGPFDTNTGLTYDSGTYNGTSGVVDVLTDTTKNWTTNQYNAYSVVNTTANWGSVIDSNTSTTATTEAAASGASHTWTSGDSYLILKAYPCADQIGRGAGVLLANANPTPIGPVNQAVDPLYEWSNSHNGTTVSAAFSKNPQHIVTNRDYYDWTATFDGSSGVGTGLLASRPTTCTPFVGYFATDTNTLYQCSAANNWVTYYTPYTYPHPLTGPAPPTALAVTSVQ